MSLYALLVDAVALVLILVGAAMVFAQGALRRSWRAIVPRDPARPPRRPLPTGAAKDGDPAHYALIIFGMMVLAFGLILATFTTVYALLTAASPHFGTYPQAKHMGALEAGRHIM